MKCPKCGFVSHPELAQCKRCGYSLVPAPPKPSSATTDAAQSLTSKEPAQDTGPGTTPDEVELEFVRDLREQVAETVNSPEAEETAAWREELSERIRNFQQRRARLRNESTRAKNFDFDFEQREGSAPPAPDLEKSLEFPPDVLAVDAETSSFATLKEGAPHSDAETLEEEAEGLEILDSGAAPAGESLEIVVEPPEVDAQAASELGVQVLPLASMGRRFLAGLADTFVLLLAAALFAFIFSKAGGHMTPVPLNLAIGALIAAFFLLAYFGLFTALIFSTPGLYWMGIEVRNMEGWPPAPGESFLRAFGYFVSVSALMTGFLWALVDSEGLTWHDRISGTFLTPVDKKSPVKGAGSRS